MPNQRNQENSQPCSSYEVAVWDQVSREPFPEGTLSMQKACSEHKLLTVQKTQSQQTNKNGSVVSDVAAARLEGINTAKSWLQL